MENKMKSKKSYGTSGKTVDKESTRNTKVVADEKNLIVDKSPKNISALTKKIVKVKVITINKSSVKKLTPSNSRIDITKATASPINTISANKSSANKSPTSKTPAKNVTKQRDNDNNISTSSSCERSCDQCDASFSNEGDYMTHYESVHQLEIKEECEEDYDLEPYSEALQCGECGKCFSKLSFLRKHESSHSSLGSRRYRCIFSSCRKTYKNKEDMKRHAKIHDSDACFKCEFCDKLFTVQDKFQNHRRTHTGEKPHVCDVCNQRFAVKAQLSIHYRLHTGETPYKCQGCLKCFRTNKAYRKHKQNHCGKVAKICQACGRHFYDSAIFYSHRNVCHEEIKPFKCTICDKQFRDSLVYKLHKDLHTKGSFKCETCGKIFVHQGQLKIHKNTHINEARYHCEICSKPFKQFCKLREHQQKHFAAKYKCSICNQKFAFASLLINHKRRHIQEVTVTEEAEPGDNGGDKANAEEEEAVHIGPNEVLKKSDGQVNENLHVCSVCQKIFSSQQALDKHFDMLHDQKNSPKCTECEEIFTTGNKWARHMRTMHPTVDFKRFNCELCGKGFRLHRYYWIHKKTHLGEADHECEICGKKCFSMAYLVKHKAKEHGENAKECVICGKTYPSQYDLNRHVLMHSTARPIECPICGLTYKRKDSLKVHQVHEHPDMDDCDNDTSKDVERPFKCDMCERAYIKESNLNTHVEYKHYGVTSERKYLCDLCDKSFKRKVHLKCHREVVHIAEYKFPCSVCGKKFKAMNNLLEHEKIHNKGYHCENCGQKFQEPEELLEHDKTHLNITVFRCSECMKAFNSHRTLKRHINNVHLRQSTIECDVCQRTFKTGFSLNRHKKMHELSEGDTKAFQCDQCDKSFHRRHNLQMHMKTHTGERPYKCNQCEKCFNRLQYLQRHEESCHDDKQPYSCLACNMEFTGCQFYYKHMESLHNETEKEKVIYFCEPCNKSFNHYVGYNTHRLWKHTDRKLPPKKTYMCEYCSKIFKQSSTLQKHIQNRHTEEAEGKKPRKSEHLREIEETIEKVAMANFVTGVLENEENFQRYTKSVSTREVRTQIQCTTCKKSFATKQGLDNHFRNDHPDCNEAIVKPVAVARKKPRPRAHCMYCEKSYSKRCYLKVHINSEHKGERKPHICPQCGQGFTERASLGRHMKNHKKQAFNYYCEQCSASFASKKWLKHHMTRSHKNKGNRCEKCGLFFKADGDMDGHMCDFNEVKASVEAITGNEDVMLEISPETDGNEQFIVYGDDIEMTIEIKPGTKEETNADNVKCEAVSVEHISYIDPSQLVETSGENIIEEVYTYADNDENSSNVKIEGSEQVVLMNEGEEYYIQQVPDNNVHVEYEIVQGDYKTEGTSVTVKEDTQEHT